MNPEPYKCAEGAGIYRLCDVPVGWETRDGDGWAWQEKWTENRSPVLVEARPPSKPVAVQLTRRLVERFADDPVQVAAYTQAISKACIDALAAES